MTSRRKIKISPPSTNPSRERAILRTKADERHLNLEGYEFDEKEHKAKLFEAVSDNDLEEFHDLVKIINRYSLNLQDISNSVNQTVLHVACQYGAVHILDHLLKVYYKG